MRRACRLLSAIMTNQGSERGQAPAETARRAAPALGRGLVLRVAARTRTHRERNRSGRLVTLPLCRRLAGQLVTECCACCTFLPVCPGKGT